MRAKALLISLVEESTNLEMVGVFTVPVEGYHEFLTHMFGAGAHVASGILHPGGYYLYAYGEELDAVYDVLIRNDEKDCIALVLVDS